MTLDDELRALGVEILATTFESVIEEGLGVGRTFDDALAAAVRERNKALLADVGKLLLRAIFKKTVRRVGNQLPSNDEPLQWHESLWKTQRALPTAFRPQQQPKCQIKLSVLQLY